MVLLIINKGNCFIKNIHKRNCFIKIINNLLSLLILAFTLTTNSAEAFTLSSKKVGDFANFGLPVTAAVISAYKDDYEGGGQLLVSFLAVQGSVLGLKSQIKVTRPDSSNERSVISGHTALTFMAASYLEQRYSWQYSIVPYALATFTGYARVHAKQHRWSEVIVGALLGQATSYFFTTAYPGDENQHALIAQLQVAPVYLTPKLPGNGNASSDSRDTAFGLKISFKM